MMADSRKLFDGLLVSGYARAGKVGDVIDRAVRDWMPERDVAAWNAVIAGCAQNRLLVGAVGIFVRRIWLKGSGQMEPHACGHLRMLKIGKVIHVRLRLCWFWLKCCMSGLIDMYDNYGNLNGAS
jgi:hypothetical protein